LQPPKARSRIDGLTRGRSPLHLAQNLVAGLQPGWEQNGVVRGHRLQQGRPRYRRLAHEQPKNFEALA